MKKIAVLFMIAAVLILSLSSCSQAQDEQRSQFKRLKHVTATFDETVMEFDINWENGVCSFESFLNYYKDPVGTYLIKLDGENILIISGDEFGDIKVIQFDDSQRVIKLFDDDDQTRVFEITYGANNVPIIDGEPAFEYDPESRIVIKETGHGWSNEIETISCERFTVDGNGNRGEATNLTYTLTADGEKQLTKEAASGEKYSYDENGNLIKYEYKHQKDSYGYDVSIVFEYYDESIGHIWERVLPYTYINIWNLYDAPLYWNLN